MRRLNRVRDAVGLLGLLAASVTAGTAMGQAVEFRIVERQGQQAVVTPLGGTALTDAVLNFAVQARVVGAAADVCLGNFTFNIHIVGEADGNGTLAKLLISNTNGTYAANTQQAANATVGRGGLAAMYTYLAGIGPDFNGLINVSGGTFTNTPDQEIGKITASPTGAAMLLLTDADGNGDPDTYPGPTGPTNGTVATIDPTIANTYLGAGGHWVDVYRFRYTVTNLTAVRTLHLTLDGQLTPVSAQVFSLWGFSNGSWGPSTPTSASVSVTGLDVHVSDVAPCCDTSTGACAMTPGNQCTNGTFAGTETCTPNPCGVGGICCATSGACTITNQGSCVGLWTPGSSCTSACPQAQACCLPTGACIMVANFGCVAGGVVTGGTCDVNPCPQPQPCCNDTGGCTMVVPLMCNGNLMSGVCTANPCPQPGACCPTGSTCLFTLPAGCATTFVPNTACSPNPCPVWGACCTSSQTCVLRLQSQCNGTSVAFLAGGYCSSTACPPIGACCERDMCTIRPQGGCEAVHGLFEGNATTCVPAGTFNACCVGNFDGMGGLQVADIFAFLSAWFEGDLRADIDQSGALTVFDIFAFIAAWRDGGCR